MSEQLALPTAVDELDRRLHSDATPQDLFQVLRTLQRLGMSKQDLTVHIERIRAINDVTVNSSVLEENALVALDIVHEVGQYLSLRWDSAEMARIYLARCISRQAIAASLQYAFQPSDLLPRRPTWSPSKDIEPQIINREYNDIREMLRAPQRAEFYRVPKVSYVTRPAALLTYPDRISYEALVQDISISLNENAPPSVHWPRGREFAADSYSAFSHAPQGWTSEYVAVTDIESFYESISHSLLSLFLGSHLAVKIPCLHALENFLDTVMASELGLPQGPPGSEVLASAFLVPVDRTLIARGWPVSRYADDYIIGASSIVDARRKLEYLEGILREIGLTLNPHKTKIMQRQTYIDGLEQPPPRVLALRNRIIGSREEYLRSSEDPVEVERILRDLGADDEILWGLLYHETMNIDEVIEEIRGNLTPSLTASYVELLRETAVSLSRRQFPNDMHGAGRDLAECLVLLASAGQQVSFADLNAIQQWFPQLAPYTAAYLSHTAAANPVGVRDFLYRWLHPEADTDWVTATLCQVAESKPELVDQRLRETLVGVVRDHSRGMLSRMVSVRVLAAADSLDPESWELLTSEASPAVRSELFFAAQQNRDNYPVSTGTLILDGGTTIDGENTK
jgi:hypothetical protein